MYGATSTTLDRWIVDLFGRVAAKSGWKVDCDVRCLGPVQASSGRNVCLRAPLGERRARRQPPAIWVNVNVVEHCARVPCEWSKDGKVKPRLRNASRLSQRGQAGVLLSLTTVLDRTHQVAQTCLQHMGPQLDTRCSNTPLHPHRRLGCTYLH